MQKKLTSIAKRYGLKLMILFGSAAENRQHKKSDIDIAVVLAKPISLQKELKLRSELFKIFKKELQKHKFNNKNSSFSVFSILF